MCIHKLTSRGTFHFKNGAPWSEEVEWKHLDPALIETAEALTASKYGTEAWLRRF